MHVTIPFQMPVEFVESYEKTLLEVIEQVVVKIQSEGYYKPYMNKKEAAQYIGVSFNTLQKFIECGLPIIEVNGVKLISRKDIDEFLEKNKQ